MVLLFFTLLNDLKMLLVYNPYWLHTAEVFIFKNLWEYFGIIEFLFFIYLGNCSQFYVIYKQCQEDMKFNAA